AAPPATACEAPAVAGRGLMVWSVSLSGTLGYPVPLLLPGVLVVRPVDRVGEGERLHLAGRVEGRKGLDLFGELDLGGIERRRVVLALGHGDCRIGLEHEVDQLLALGHRR